MTDGTPRVRDARPQDAAAIAALQVRSWKAAYRGIAPDAFLHGLTEDAWSGGWRDALSRPPAAGVHRLVSVPEGHAEPVAVAQCGPVLEEGGPATAQLYVLYADPSSWGRGHGGALLDEVCRRLVVDGHEAALLWVAAGNERAIAVYEHRGWRLDGAAQTEDVAGIPFDEVRMLLDLRAHA